MPIANESRFVLPDRLGNDAARLGMNAHKVPVGRPSAGSCWVEISHDGQFLFALNTGSGTISRFSVAPTAP